MRAVDDVRANPNNLRVKVGQHPPCDENSFAECFGYQLPRGQIKEMLFNCIINQIQIGPNTKNRIQLNPTIIIIEKQRYIKPFN